MNYLALYSFILPLSRYQSPGEALFVGAISGLLLLGIIELISFIKNKRNKE